MGLKTKEIAVAAPGGTSTEFETIERPDITATGGESTTEDLMAQLAALLGGNSSGNSALDQANAMRAGNIQSGAVDLSDMFGGGCVC